MTLDVTSGYLGTVLAEWLALGVLRGQGGAVTRSSDVWMTEVHELRDLIDEAYAEARAKVFDLEGPKADRSRRTLQQRQIVERLETLEARMHELRELHG